MNNTLRDTNYVTLIGRVTDTISEPFTTLDGKSYINIRMVVKRLSGIEDYMTLTMPADQATYLPYNDKLFVKGDYRTYNIDGHLEQRVFVKEWGTVDPVNEDVNQFLFTGTIVSIKPLRESPMGKIITDITVAVNNGKRSAYIPCVVWGTLARYITDSPIGTKVSCTGRLQSRLYEKVIDNISHTRMAYEVSILDLEVVGDE